MADCEESAILQVSSVAKSAAMNYQDSKDTDVLSNNSLSFEGSVIASPSVGSFSTFPDNEFSEYALDTRDLQVRVDNPQKHLDTLETYITFRITTKTSRAEFDETEYVVRRRYNDFTWLREKLVSTFPTHLIPPLPGKHSLLAQLDRYSKEFVVARMSLLHRFLNRVANHPIISFNADVKLFLTAKPSEFSVARRSGPSLMNRVSGSLHNMAAALHDTPRPAPEFERASEYASMLGEKLGEVDRITQRIAKQRQDYLHLLSQLQPALTLWSASEPELSAALLALASSVEAQARTQRQLLSQHPATLAQPLEEYRLYVEAVKQAVDRRSAVQAQHEQALEQLQRARQEKTQLMTEDASQASTFGSGFGWREGKEGKLARLNQTIPDLVKLVEESEDKMECANENLRADLERWHLEKCSDLKQLFVTLADQQVKSYEESLQSWEAILPIMKADMKL